MKKPILIFFLAIGSIPLIAQDFQRVAPQVTSTTMVIDQNSDAKKMKENLLYVLKNAGQDEYLAYYALIKSAIAVLKDKRPLEDYVKISKDSTGSSHGFNVKVGNVEVGGSNELILLLKLFENIPEDEEKLLDLVKEKIKSDSSIPFKPKMRAQVILESYAKDVKRNTKSWKEKLDKKRWRKKISNALLETDTLGKIYISHLPGDARVVSVRDTLLKLINGLKKIKVSVGQLESDLEIINKISPTDLVKDCKKELLNLSSVRSLGFFLPPFDKPDYFKARDALSARGIQEIEFLLSDMMNRKLLDDKLIKKISSLVDLGLTLVHTNSTQSNSVRDVCTDIEAYLPSIIGLNIEEQDRIKATTEIIFNVLDFMEDFKVDSTANANEIKFTIVGSQPLTMSKSVKLSAAIQNFVKTMGDRVKRNLIQKLGPEDPAVIHFDIFYSKVLVRLKNLSDNTAIAPVLDKSINDIEASLANKNELTEFLKNQIMDLINNQVDKSLKEGLKNPSRIAWVNNFNTQQGSAELNTTVAYKLINRPSFIWEASTNFFYNTLNNVKNIDTTKTAKGDSLKKSFARQVFIGSNWRYITKNNKWEFGLIAAVTGHSINSIEDRTRSKSLHSYLGFNVGIRLGPAVYRPFYEWEFQQTKNGRDLNSHNIGLDVKLPDRYVISGFFLNYKINDLVPNAASLGIKFPIIK